MSYSAHWIFLTVNFLLVLKTLLGFSPTLHTLTLDSPVATPSPACTACSAWPASPCEGHPHHCSPHRPSSVFELLALCYVITEHVAQAVLPRGKCPVRHMLSSIREMVDGWNLVVIDGGGEGSGWAHLYNRTQGSFEKTETRIPTPSSQDSVIETWLIDLTCSLIQGGSEQGFLEEELDEIPEIEALWAVKRHTSGLIPERNLHWKENMGHCLRGGRYLDLARSSSPGSPGWRWCVVCMHKQLTWERLFCSQLEEPLCLV